MISDHVLCPQLYTQLQRLFSEVRVGNQGIPISWRPQQVEGGKWNFNISDSGEYYRVCCPFCNDRRFRLWINHMYGQFTADGTTRLSWLAVCFNETQCMNEYENRKQLEELVFGFRNANMRDSVFEVKEAEFSHSGRRGYTSPGTTVPVSSMPSAHPSVQYLLNKRKYTLDRCDYYNISILVQPAPQFGWLQDRIIFPIVQYSEPVGWQARIATDDFDAKRTAKYFGMPGMHKGSILYNLDRALGKPFVVVVEGVTDVHSIGDYAVATLGCSLSPPQRQLLEYNWRDKPVVLLWDPEAVIEKQDAIAKYRESRTGPLVVVTLPAGTDPGSLSTDVAWGYIKQAAERENVFLY